MNPNESWSAWGLRTLDTGGALLLHLYAVKAAHRMLLARARRASTEGRRRDAAVCLRLATHMRRELVFIRSGGYHL